MLILRVLFSFLSLADLLRNLFFKLMYTYKVFQTVNELHTDNAKYSLTVPTSFQSVCIPLSVFLFILHLFLNVKREYQK